MAYKSSNTCKSFSKFSIEDLLERKTQHGQHCSSSEEHENEPEILNYIKIDHKSPSQSPPMLPTEEILATSTNSSRINVNQNQNYGVSQFTPADWHYTTVGGNVGQQFGHYDFHQNMSKGKRWSYPGLYPVGQPGHLILPQIQPTNTNPQQFWNNPYLLESLRNDPRTTAILLDRLQLNGSYGMQAYHHGIQTQPLNMRINGLFNNGFNGGSKRKGGQIRFSHHQTGQLEKAFLEHKYLNANDRKKLAASLNLCDRQVKTWFQNRRAKFRKTRNESSQEAEMTSSSSIETISPQNNRMRFCDSPISCTDERERYSNM